MDPSPTYALEPQLTAAQSRSPHHPPESRRRIYALRTDLCLQAFGVTDFATANVKDFEDTGFAKVWNPMAI